MRPALGLLVILALAGCGGAAGGDPASLLVTERFGAATLEQRSGVPTGDGARALAGPGTLFVNGRRAEDDVEVRAGDQVWADRARSSTRAVVGSFPAPFTTGFDGKRLPVRVECVEQDTRACRAVRDALVARGVVASRGGLATSLAKETLRVLVGPWRAIRGDAALRTIEEGPAASGVFARPTPDGRSIVLLDPRGARTGQLDAGAGLVAATADDDALPVWLVTGTDAAGVEGAAATLAAQDLVGRYAVATSSGRVVPLPDRPDGGGAPPGG